VLVHDSIPATAKRRTTRPGGTFKDLIRTEQLRRPGRMLPLQLQLHGQFIERQRELADIAPPARSIFAPPDLQLQSAILCGPGLFLPAGFPVGLARFPPRSRERPVKPKVLPQRLT